MRIFIALFSALLVVSGLLYAVYRFTPLIDPMISELTDQGSDSACFSDRISGKLFLHKDILNEPDAFERSPAMVFDNTNIESIEQQIDEFTQQPQLQVWLTKEAGEQFADLSEEMIDRKLGIFVDGQLVSAPMVMTRITGGSLVLTDGYESEQTGNSESIYQTLCPAED